MPMTFALIVDKTSRVDEAVTINECIIRILPEDRVQEVNCERRFPGSGCATGMNVACRSRAWITLMSLHFSLNLRLKFHVECTADSMRYNHSSFLVWSSS